MRVRGDRRVALADLGQRKRGRDVGSFSGGEAVSAAVARPVVAAGGCVYDARAGPSRLSRSGRHSPTGP